MAYSDKKRKPTQKAPQLFKNMDNFLQYIQKRFPSLSAEEVKDLHHHLSQEKSPTQAIDQFWSLLNPEAKLMIRKDLDSKEQEVA